MSQEKKISTEIIHSESSQDDGDTETEIDSLDDCSMNHDHELDSETESDQLASQPRRPCGDGRQKRVTPLPRHYETMTNTEAQARLSFDNKD